MKILYGATDGSPYTGGVRERMRVKYLKLPFSDEQRLIEKSFKVYDSSIEESPYVVDTEARTIARVYFLTLDRDLEFLKLMKCPEYKVLKNAVHTFVNKVNHINARTMGMQGYIDDLLSFQGHYVKMCFHNEKSRKEEREVLFKSNADSTRKLQNRYLGYSLEKMYVFNVGGSIKTAVSIPFDDAFMFDFLDGHFKDALSYVKGIVSAYKQVSVSVEERLSENPYDSSVDYLRDFVEDSIDGLKD